MSGRFLIIAITLCVAALTGCKKDDENPVIANYIFATPSSVTMVGGRDTTVSLSGGVPPYVILQSPKANIASVSLDSTIVHIHSALSSGTDHIRIGDSAPTQNTVTIQIVVVTSPLNHFIHVQ
ncbi:MAG: hypothetical protein HY033_02525 [Ignavibacteriae bacterium]|nr:hypothetical protein [Ignavibacteria bacterium]MBI3363762.1 hypothetical protein [Ignavibacteriota bacterium]